MKHDNQQQKTYGLSQQHLSVRAREKESENFRIKQQSTTYNLLFVPVTGTVVNAACQCWYVKERRRVRKRKTTINNKRFTSAEASTAVLAVSCQYHLPVHTRKRSEKF